MSKIRLPILALLLSLFGATQVFSQRVIAYHQGWRNNEIEDFYWDYVTDVNYSFAQLNSWGGVDFGLNGTNDPSQTLDFTNFKTMAINNNVKFHMSFGGADPIQAGYFKSNVSTDAKAATLALNMVNFAIANGAAGIDIDWEPASDVSSNKPSAAEWTLLAKKLREAITASGETLELSAAVFPFKWKSDFVTSSCFQYFDHLNLMVYDFGAAYESHSNYMTDLNGWDDPDVNFDYSNMTVEEACITYWNGQKGLPKNKMVLGLPFYGRAANTDPDDSNYASYRTIVNSGGSATSDSHNSWRYNGKTTIERKTTYAIDNGLKGVMYWEWVNDATTEAKSLQATITGVIDVVGLCAEPDLGAMQNICGKASISLNPGSNVSEADYTYEWFNGTQKQAATGYDFDATVAGTYRVDITHKTDGCSRSSFVVIEGTYGDLPTIDDISICGAATDVDATITGAENFTYTWTKQGGGTISNTATASISEEGTYTIEVSDTDGPCATKTDEVLASAITVDVITTDVCKSGDDGYYEVQDASGTYKWYTEETGGLALGDPSNSHELYQPVDGNPVWVSKVGGATGYTVGLNYDHAPQMGGASDLGPGTCGTFGGDYEEFWNASGKNPDHVKLYFSVLQTITISSFKGRFLSSGTPTLRVYNENTGASVELTELAQEIFVAGSSDGDVVILPTPLILEAGDYSIGVTAGDNADVLQWVEKCTSGTGDFPYSTYGIDGVINFTHSSTQSVEGVDDYDTPHWYAGFYDIEISTGKACPRISAEAVVDPALCLGVSITIDEPGDNATFDFSEDVTITTTVIDDDGGSITSVVATIGGQDITLTSTGNANEYSGIWNTGTTTLTDADLSVKGISDSGNEKTVSIKVNVVNNNVAPVVTITSPSNLDELNKGEAVQFVATVVDANIKTVMITIAGNEYAMTAGSGNTYTYDWTTGSLVETIAVSVTATDDFDLEDTDAISIKVINTDPDVLTIGNPSNGGTVTMGEKTVISITATDSDGTISTVAVTTTDGAGTGNAAGSGPYTIDWTPTQLGSQTISVIATDNDGATIATSITVTVEEANTEAIIVFDGSLDGSTINTGDAVTIDFTVTDNGSITSSNVTLEVIGTSTETVALSGASPFSASWTSSAAGGYQIKVTVIDAGGLTTTESVNITVNDVDNLTPVVDVTGPTGGTIYDEGEMITVSFTAVDNETPITTSDLTVTYNGQTQVITESGGVFTAQFVAVYGQEEIIVQANDGNSVGSSTIAIIVNELNVDPTVSIESPNNGDEIATNSAMSFVLSASDANVSSANMLSTVTLAIVGPSGTENPSVGGTEPNYSASWTPTVEGTYTVTATATDGQSVTITDVITITVSDDANILPDVIVTLDPSNGEVDAGDVINISVSATDADGIKSYKIEVDGEVINSSSYDWTATSVGPHTVTVTVIDNNDGETIVNKTITVNEVVISDDVITVVSPTDGTMINNPGEITFNIDVNDPVGTTIDKVRYQIIGSNNEILIYTVDATDEFDLVWLPSEVGSYTITMIAIDTDGNAVETKIITTTLTGVIDLNNNTTTGISGAVYINEVSVYPSPATSNATVAISARTAGDVVIEVLDMNGNIIISENGYMSSGDLFEVNFSVENLTSGIYLTRVTLSGETVTKKLVVQ